MRHVKFVFKRTIIKNNLVKEMIHSLFAQMEVMQIDSKLETMKVYQKEK